MVKHYKRNQKSKNYKSNQKSKNYKKNQKSKDYKRNQNWDVKEGEYFNGKGDKIHHPEAYFKVVGNNEKNYMIYIKMLTVK